MLLYIIYLIPRIKVLCLSPGCQIGQETRPRGNSQNSHVEILIKKRMRLSIRMFPVTYINSIIL